MMMAQATKSPVKQQLAELFKVLSGMRVGMITNPTSVDEELLFLPDFLALDKSVPFNFTNVLCSRAWNSWRSTRRG